MSTMPGLQGIVATQSAISSIIDGGTRPHQSQPARPGPVAARRRIGRRRGRIRLLR